MAVCIGDGARAAQRGLVIVERIVEDVLEFDPVDAIVLAEARILRTHDGAREVRRNLIKLTQSRSRPFPDMRRVIMTLETGGGTTV